MSGSDGAGGVDALLLVAAVFVGLFVVLWLAWLLG